MTARKRRWFAFSLRALFVVITLACLWLGYYVNWMSQRREARVWLDMQSIGGSFVYDRKPASAFPWMLKLIGEEPTRVILMRHGPSDHYSWVPKPNEYRALVNHIERLFPEAVVIDVTNPHQVDAEQDQL